ncbi:MAG: hypothetical protein WDZ84_01465 [Rhodovibrionaceae bacterium]
MLYWKIFLSVVLAVVVPFIIDSFVALNNNEKIILGVLVFVVTSLVMIEIYIASIANRAEAEVKLIEQKNVFHELLLELQECHSKLLQKAGTESDLFVRAFTEEIEEINRRMAQSVSSGELKESKRHLIRTDTILDVFSFTEADECIDVFCVDHEYDVLDHYSLNYFVKKLEKLRSRDLKRIRSIFVYDTNNVKVTGDLKEVLNFYASKKGLDFVVLDCDLYNELYENNLLDEQCLDFALYGDRYMYKTLSYEPAIEGVFVNNIVEIQRYKRFFDACWNSPAAHKPPEVAKTQLIDVQEFTRRLKLSGNAGGNAPKATGD